MSRAQQQDPVTSAMLGSTIAFWRAAECGRPVEWLPLVLRQAVIHPDEFFCLARRIGGFEKQAKKAGCDGIDRKEKRRRIKNAETFFRRVVDGLVALRESGEADTAMFVSLAFARDPRPLIDLAYRYAEEVESGEKL